MLTIPYHEFTPYLPKSVAWIKGQLEVGDSGFLHWQVFVCFQQKQSLRAVKSIFGDKAHAELSRSIHAEAYVWKDATRITNTQFELGIKPFNRSSEFDWERVWALATARQLLDIPASVRISHYRTFKSIGQDHLQPIAQQRRVRLYWGATGTGKTRRAWEEASLSAYPKPPTTKYFDGYSGQDCIILDEFRGDISVSHLLRWFDRYPVIVEVKGTSTVLTSRNWWVTSNLHPRDWYPNVDPSTYDALMRRFDYIEEFK